MVSSVDSTPGESRVSARTVGALSPTSSFSSVMRLVLAVVGTCAVMYELGFRIPEGQVHIARHVIWGSLVAYTLIAWADVVRKAPRDSSLRAERWVALFGAVMGWWFPGAVACAMSLLLIRLWSGYIWLLAKGVHASLVFVGSFAALIIGGTGLLMLPAATPVDKPIRFIDALFTATSASCVTGLVVRDTGSEFTRFGQTVILGLFQLGGLGTVLFGGMVALLMGSGLSLRAVHALSVSAASGQRGVAGIKRLVMFAGGAVLLTEAVGALCLYLGWPDSWPGGPEGLSHWPDRVFNSIFFSVSAFCNAGFATCATGLEGMRSHWTSHIIISGLIFVGGMGLPVLLNFTQIGRSWFQRKYLRQRGMPARLTLHSKLAMTTTIWLYLMGVLLIWIGQYAQADVAAWQALLDAHFMSGATRTAGFDTVGPAQMGMLSRMTMVVAMFIGGSPGSTAGGLKTMSFAVLMLVVWSAVLDRDSVRVFGRSIKMEIISRAAALLVLHAVLCMTVAAVLCVTEDAERGVPPKGVSAYEQYVFEAVSACSTCGLSMGLTSHLSDGGKIAVMAGMFLGRVGSLALLVSLAGIARRTRARYAYPTEGVVLS